MITRIDAEQWLESERVRLGMASLELRVSDLSTTYTAGTKSGAFKCMDTFEAIEKFVAEHDPLKCAKETLAIAQEELEKLEKGDG